MNVNQAVKESFSYSDVLKKLNRPSNGKTHKRLKKEIKDNNLSIEHFDRFKRNKERAKWKTIIKNCPVCNNEFKTKENHPREKSTCSKGCSNTYFRSGENNGNYLKDKVNDYRSICFANHKKECIICKEKLAVAVHHYDGNHDNNIPENLVPLCPTHHLYWHSNNRGIIKERAR